jgi:8-hydroxy-5-deazaflavin:NADPH oxidoreductase
MTLTGWLTGCAAKGSGIRTGSFAESAAHGEILAFAVLGTVVESAIQQAPRTYPGKVVIDATNPLDFSRRYPPALAWGCTDSGGEHGQN